MSVGRLMGINADEPLPKEYNCSSIEYVIPPRNPKYDFFTLDVGINRSSSNILTSTIIIKIIYTINNNKK